jgi:hypothetical protein
MPLDNPQMQSPPVSQPQGGLDLRKNLEETRAALGVNPAIEFLAPPSERASRYDTVMEGVRREEGASFGDYAGAVWRQDGVLDGIAAWAAEKQAYDIDPRYDPFDEKQQAELIKGIDPAYHGAFFEAKSAAHAQFIRDRLLEKQKDLAHLSDLGVAGTTARLLAGFVEPTNLALALASGGAYTALRGGASIAKGVKLVSTAGADAAQAARGAEMIGKIAKAESSLPALFGSLGGAGVGGYAFERLRQSVNFEDSQTDALMAGIMSVAFAAPFVGLSARQMRRLRASAEAELDTFNRIAAIQRGERAATVEDLADAALLDARARDLSGEKAKRAAEVEAAYDARRQAAQAEIDAAWAGAGEGLTVRSEMLHARGRAERAAEQAPAQTAAKVRRNATSLRESLVAKAKEDTAARVARALDDVPADSPMALAFAKAVGRKAAAEGRLSTAAAAPQESDTILARLIAAEGDVQPAPAPVPAPPRKGAVGDHFGAAGAEPTAPAPAPRGDADFLGSTTEWVDAHGETQYGTILSVREDGRLMIERHSDGRRVPVSRGDLAADAPGFVAEENPFLAGSVGSAQVGAVPGPARDPIDTALKQFRFDIFARLAKDPNPEVRGLADLMVKDAIQASDFYAQARTASEEKKLLTRRLGGQFHTELANAFHAAEKKRGGGWGGRRAREEQFAVDVGVLARGDEAVLALPRNAGIEAELRKAAGTFTSVMDTMLNEMVAAGVKNADAVKADGPYVPRVWLASHLRDAILRHRKDTVDLFADALKGIDKEGLPLKGNRRLAERFIATLIKLEHSALPMEVGLQSRDMGTLRSELKAYGLSPSEVDTIVDVMFEVRPGDADAGAAPHLKFRLNLDETAHAVIEGKRVSLSDFMENDSRILMDRYLNSMAGHIGMAKKGIGSRADFEAAIKRADDWHAEHGIALDPKAFEESKTLLRDMYNHITGRPMSVQSYGTLDRMASILRGFARSVYLGQLGWTAATELTHAAGHATWSAAFTQMPAFRQLWRAMRAGYVPEGTLVDDLRVATGFSMEHVSSHARMHEVGNFGYGGTRGFLDRMENASNRASHIVDSLSGNNFMTSYTRGLAAAFTTQKYANFALGKKRLNAEARKRIVGMGIDEDMIDTVLDNLKKHSQVAPDGTLERIRFEEWSLESPDTYGQFVTAIQREVRTSIQDHDIGETWWWQHSSLGKVFTELRAFSIAAHSKQFLHGAHYRDAQTLHLWTVSFTTQALAYMVQTSINFAHNPAEREKRLSVDRIVRASVGRMNVLGLMAPVLDTAVLRTVAPQYTLSGSGLTANTDNRNLFTTPSMMLVGRAVSGAQAVGQSVFAGQHFTGDDVRSLLGTLPGSNLWGARNLVDLTANLAPARELPQP